MRHFDVFCRVNPRNTRTDDIALGVACIGASVKLLEDPPNRIYGPYSHVFGTDTSQEQVFDVLNDCLCFSDVLAGKSAALLAYGQTGSGKTYTIYGESRTPVRAGVITRALDTIFTAQHLSSLMVKVSHISIYHEDIRDLLSDTRTREGLSIRESASRGTYIEGLTEVEVWSAEEGVQQMVRGLSNIGVFATQMEIQTSRMHTMFTIVVYRNEHSDGDDTAMKISADEQPIADSKGSEPVLATVGRLAFVDLAGSERILRSGASMEAHSGMRVDRSLATLTTVITSLAGHASGGGAGFAGRQSPPVPVHIPYRGSKLTRLLRDYLASDAPVAIVGTMTCWMRDLEETKQTLRCLTRMLPPPAPPTPPPPLPPAPPQLVQAQFVHCSSGGDVGGVNVDPDPSQHQERRHDQA